MKYVGLGDILSSLFETMGITATDNCGCNKRKELLNQWFPYAGLIPEQPELVTQQDSIAELTQEQSFATVKQLSLWEAEEK